MTTCFRTDTLGYSQLLGLSHIMGLQSGGHYQLAAGTGTVGYEPNVSYFFGFPKAIQPGGVAFDIPLLNISGMDDGDKAKQKQFVMQTGVLSSALEHGVPEQMFKSDPKNPLDAISAVKALQKASSAGQRIYHITQANQSVVLGNIHHDANTMNEIRSALIAGKEVVTHTDSVSIPGWKGAGYIILDKDTGSGAYKIVGGGNGSYLTFPAMALAFLQALAPFFIVTPWLALLAGIAGIIAHTLMVLSLLDNKAGMADYAAVRMITMILTVVLIIIIEQYIIITFPMLFIIGVIASVISAITAISQRLT